MNPRIKRTIALLAVATAALGIFAASASAGGVYPVMSRGWAYEATLAQVRKDAGWRYRDSGSINCNGGRIDGHEWSCRVKWTNSGECVYARSRVVGYYAANGEPWSWTVWQGKGRYCGGY